MSGTNSSQGGLTRRGFLKTTAAVAGTTVALGGLSGCAQSMVEADPASAVAEESYVTFCRGNCGSPNCNFDVKVREGKVVNVVPRIFPDADPKTKGRSRACLRGMSNLQRLYAEDRIHYPMRRAGERGEDLWERLSWDEAISYIGEKWRGYISEYGASSIALWPIYGSVAAINGKTGVAWTRLANTLGMSTLDTGGDQALIYTTGVLMNGLGYGSDGPALAEHCKNLIVWGTNPAESWPHEWRYICDARENGCKMIVIDPRVSATAAKADKLITIRPASDAAFAMAVCNYLLETDQLDYEFMKKSSTAAFLVKKSDGLFLRESDFGGEPVMVGTNRYANQAITLDAGYVWDKAVGKAVPVDSAVDPAFEGTYTVNGQEVTVCLDLLRERVSEWTIERACELCDVTEDDILAVVEALLDGPSTIMMANGLAHFSNSHTVFTSSVAAAILTGNFGKPGAGWCDNAVTPLVGFYPNVLWAYPSFMVPGPHYSVLELPNIMETGMNNGAPAVIKSVIVEGGNPLGNVPGRTALLEALSKIDLVITVDMSFTDTARYSDVVLPAAHWYEVNDTSGGQYVPYTLLGEKAIDPLFEHKSDFDIAALLGTEMGYGEHYTESLEDVMKIMLDQCGVKDLNGELITYDRVMEEKNIRVMPDGFYDTTYNIQDGRLSFYIEKPVPRINYGVPLDVELERLPYFEPPAEAWPETVGGYEKNPLADKYPLIFFSMHCRFRTHTTYSHAPWLLELQDGPVIHMNPNDAAARGIEQGDLVKAYNDRGYVVIKAVLDPAMKPGTVNVPHGWQENQFIDGHYQNLTSNVTHPFDSNENYYDCLCEVEKYEGGE